MKKLILQILLLIIGCTSSYGLEITFKGKARVTTNYITLGDVATFDETTPLTKALATKIIGKSPSPGEKVFLQAAEVQKLLLRKTQLRRNTGWSGSSVIDIHRAGQQVLPEKLIDAIDSYIAGKGHALPDAEVVFQPKSLPLPFMLPQGKLSIEVVPSNPEFTKSSRFSLILRVDGKVRKNLSIQGDLQVLAPVAVSVGTLKRGTILTPANTSFIVKDITDFSDPCTDSRAILGKRLKRTLRSAQVINSSDVEFPPLVKKGQLVKVIVNSGSLYLTATGIARTNGMLNEIIRVQNASSRKIIYCRVAAPGIVEVKI